MLGYHSMILLLPKGLELRSLWSLFSGLQLFIFRKLC